MFGDGVCGGAGQRLVGGFVGVTGSAFFQEKLCTQLTLTINGLYISQWINHIVIVVVLAGAVVQLNTLICKYSSTSSSGTFQFEVALCVACTQVQVQGIWSKNEASKLLDVSSIHICQGEAVVFIVAFVMH